MSKHFLQPFPAVKLHPPVFCLRDGELLPGGTVFFSLRPDKVLEWCIRKAETLLPAGHTSASLVLQPCDIHLQNLLAPGFLQEPQDCERVQGVHCQPSLSLQVCQGLPQDRECVR